MPFRLQEAKAYEGFIEQLAQPKTASPTPMISGVTSVNMHVPSVLQYCGVSNLTVISRIPFGVTPHVWFYVITCNHETRITADVKLPLSPKTSALNAIMKAAKGTALEHLLQIED